MRVSISEARVRLAELAQLVMDSPDAEVIIEHRDRKERLVLTTERRVRALEEMVKNLRRQIGETPFVLAGSITSDLTDDELNVVLAQIRTDADAAWQKKLASLTDE